MATGTIEFEKSSLTSNKSYVLGKIEYKYEQDNSKNESAITFDVYVKKDNDSLVLTETTNGTFEYQLIVNGETITGSASLKILSSYVKIGSFARTISHNNDGSKSLTVKGYVWLSNNSSSAYYHKKSSVDTSITLARIPRASTITSAANVTLSENGTNCRVVWTPLASTFKYKLKFVCGNVVKWLPTEAPYVISPGSTSAYTYSIYPMTINMWASGMPNSYSATCTVTLYTYTPDNIDSELTSTSKAIGSSSKTFTLTLPNTVKPTASIADPVLVNGLAGCYVQGKSKCTLSATFSAGAGSTIRSCSISGAGLSKTGTGATLSGTTNILTTSGDITYTARVEDGRKTETTTKTIHVWPYATPTITSTAVRTSSGDSIKITYNASCSPVNSNNKITTLKIYKRLATTSNWPTDATKTINGTNSSTANGSVTLDNFDSDNSYYVKVVVVDTVGSSSEAVVSVPSAFRIVNIQENKKGIAIGKMSERDIFDCGLDAEFEKSTTFNGSAEFKTNTTFKGAANFAENATFAKNTSVSGNATFSNYIKVSGDVKIEKDGYTSYIRSDPNDTDSNILYIMIGTNTDGGSEAGIAIHKNSVYVPHEGNNGVINLGHGSRRWKQVYALNDTISTSDRKEKMDIVDMSDTQEQLFNRLKPVTFKLVKGTSGRTHYGFVSQDVEESLDELALTGQDFAGFCKDLRIDDNGNAILDENNNQIYDYSLRYSEFIALNTYMIQKLQAENKELKAELQELKSIITSSNNED